MKLKIIILSLVCLTPFFDATENVESCKAQNEIKRRKEDVSAEIVDYNTILKHYYKMSVGKANFSKLSYEDFRDNYYSNDYYDIASYTLKVAKEYNNYDNAAAELGLDNVVLEDLNYETTYSSDAYYIIDDNRNGDFAITPASYFKRRPLYGAYDYSNLDEGAIVYETDTPFFDTGHDTLIVDMSHDSQFGSYIQTIEAVASGVRYGYLDDCRMIDYKVSILRPKSFYENNQKAVEFAQKQLYKPYFLDIFRLNTSINSSQRYCSELVYACWKYAGIDIGVKNNEPLKHGCLPSDIRDSDNISGRAMQGTWFLGVRIISKTGGTWTLEINNNTYGNVKCEYCPQLCIYRHAIIWDNLPNIQTVYIKRLSSVKVTCNDHIASSTFAASYVANHERVITCADHLDTNKKLTTHRNVVEYLEYDTNKK